MVDGELGMGGEIMDEDDVMRGRLAALVE